MAEKIPNSAWKNICSKIIVTTKDNPFINCSPHPDLNILNEINDVLYDFLWNGRAKLKQSVVIEQYFEGGLKMINTKTYAKALKLTWIIRILQEERKWQLLLKNTNISGKAFSLWIKIYKMYLTTLANCFLERCT